MALNFDFVLRLLVAGILGAIIGLDREYRAKEAGYRTHFLVSLGSALIMIVSQYGFQDIIKENSVSLDPSRVAAQVVSGIGLSVQAPSSCKTDCTRTDHCGRNMGHRRHRSGGWSRNVCDRHCRHSIDFGRTGAPQHLVQKCRNEKFHDNLLYSKQGHTQRSFRPIQIPELYAGLLQNGKARLRRNGEIHSDYGHQIQAEQ